MQESVVLLKQISSDLGLLKEKVVRIERIVEEIDDDLHEVRPEYIEKLKKIEAGKVYHYKNASELRKAIEKD